jgi:cytochrome bd ubiquinol oxidase subunit II
MTVIDAVAAVLFAGLVAYGVFGGADFGAGLWDLTAGDTHKGGPLRSLIDHSIGPVWEANHVWLIFVLVFLWTGFPRGFGAIVTTLAVPLAAAALGITLRGATFAFRKSTGSLAAARVFGVVFALSSVVTPFFLGTIAGAVASGRVPSAGGGNAWSSWTGPASLLGGVLAVGTCAYLAGVFLVADAERNEHHALAETLRRRVLGLGVVVGIVAMVGIVVLAADAPTLTKALLGRGAPLVAMSAVGGAASLRGLWVGQYRAARMAAVVAVASVLVGWGVGQYPWLLVDQMRLDEAAGAPSTMRALLGVGVLAAAIVVPSLAWLFRLVNLPERPAS